MRSLPSARPLAAIAAAAFLLAGILGLVPGATSHYDRLAFAGAGSHAKLLGLFQVSVLHDVVHLLLGATGLVLARTTEGARAFLSGATAASLALWLLGVAGGASWLPANPADNWLHFAVGLGALGLGFLVAPSAPRPASVDA